MSCTTSSAGTGSKLQSLAKYSLLIWYRLGRPGSKGPVSTDIFVEKNIWYSDIVPISRISPGDVKVMLNLSSEKSIFPRLRSPIFAGGYKLSPTPIVDPMLIINPELVLLNRPDGTKVDSSLRAVLPQQEGVLGVGVEGMDLI